MNRALLWLPVCKFECPVLCLQRLIAFFNFISDSKSVLWEILKQLIVATFQIIRFGKILLLFSCVVSCCNNKEISRNFLNWFIGIPWNQLSLLTSSCQLSWCWNKVEGPTNFAPRQFTFVAKSSSVWLLLQTWRNLSWKGPPPFHSLSLLSVRNFFYARVVS